MSLRLDAAVDRLPQDYPGPGGAVAVLRDGQVLVRHAWGMADPAGRIAFTPQSVVPICSITKQFTCALLLALHDDPATLDADVRAALPGLAEAAPTASHLANNQSGLRDYWALTVLCGADPEGDFRPEDAARMTRAIRSLHFRPGTRYSYCNLNFRILGDILETRAGTDLGTLYGRHLLDPAGMATARYRPETAAPLPGGAIGHEGTAATGIFRAVNRIHWAGDAGLCASLDDMIAWETFIDASRDQADGLYARLSAPVHFADGRPARYGMGLAHLPLFGRRMTGHGGALRGWRARRLHSAQDRLSVVVLFNHDHDTAAAALSVMTAALDLDEPAAPGGGDPAALAGMWFEPETGLVLSVAVEGGRIRARFGGSELAMAVGPDGVARHAEMTLAPDGAGLRLDRPGDNLSARLEPLQGPAGPGLAGRWRSDELQAEVEIADFGGVLHAGFEGFLGRGAFKPLIPAGPGRWTMPDMRAMDSAPPGAWTLALDGRGEAARLRVGCLIARDIAFRRS